MVEKIVTDLEIIRIKDNRRSKEEDQVVAEMPLTLFVNGKGFITLLCSPAKLKCLAIGFLYSEGLLKTSADILNIRVDLERNAVFVETALEAGRVEKLSAQRTITSGGGKGMVFFNVLDSLQGKPVESSLKISVPKLLQLMAALQKRALLHKATGGVHSSALADREGILFYSEDIGRHNAVDKIVGECILKNISVGNKILLTSGRLTSEIVVKASKLRLPFLVSRSAPTSLGVRLAAEMGITLVGFVRGGRLNIYTHEFRVN